MLGFHKEKGHKNIAATDGCKWKSALKAKIPILISDRPMRDQLRHYSEFKVWMKICKWNLHNYFFFIPQMSCKIVEFISIKNNSKLEKKRALKLILDNLHCIFIASYFDPILVETKREGEGKGGL